MNRREFGKSVVITATSALLPSIMFPKNEAWPKTRAYCIEHGLIYSSRCQRCLRCVEKNKIYRKYDGMDVSIKEMK